MHKARWQIIVIIRIFEAIELTLLKDNIMGKVYICSQLGTESGGSFWPTVGG